MAESTVKASSPVVTLVMNLDEARLLVQTLEEAKGTEHGRATIRNDRLLSVRSALQEAVRNGDTIVKGGVESVYTP